MKGKIEISLKNVNDAIFSLFYFFFIIYYNRYDKAI